LAPGKDGKNLFLLNQETNELLKVLCPHQYRSWKKNQLIIVSLMLPIQLPLAPGEDGKNLSNNSIKEETLQGFFASSNIAVGKRINYSREEQTLQGFIAKSDKTVGKRMN
jgi:hypothetical protein